MTVSVESPLQDRVVFVAGPREAALAHAKRLAARPGWTGRPAPTGLGATAGAWLAGFDLGGGGAGLSALVDDATFLTALRGLTDAPYLQAATRDRAGRVVDVLDDDVSVAVARRLYPDATVVAPGDDVAEADVAPVADPVAPAVGDVERGLILVVGSGRSGTTWLHRLLTAHPAVTGTADGETWLFRGVGRFWRAHRNGDGLEAWLDEDALLGAIRRCCDTLLSAGRSRLSPTATHLVEKTPAHVWELPLLARLYPDAAYVHLLRDGRDVALSLARVDGAYDGPGPAAAAWASAVRAVRVAAPGLRRYTEVRYEDVLRDPVDVVGRVLGWIGLPPDAAFRDAAYARVDERVSPLPSEGPVGAGKWRGMEPASIAAVEAAAGELLLELGYV